MKGSQSEATMEISTEQKVRFGDLRAILRYVPLFRGQRFVVAVDGAVLNSGGVASFLLTHGQETAFTRNHHQAS